MRSSPPSSRAWRRMKTIMKVTIATAIRPTIASNASCWRCGRFSSISSSTTATPRQSATASATPAHIQRSASERPCWRRKVAMIPTISAASTPSRRPITKWTVGSAAKSMSMPARKAARRTDSDLGRDALWGRALRRGLPHRSYLLGVPKVYHRPARRRPAGYRSVAVSDAQISFLQFDDPPAPAPADADARPQRLSSKGIAPGDLVEVDKKGRRFHALVVALQQRDSGRFELELKPLDSAHLVPLGERARGRRAVAQGRPAPARLSARYPAPMSGYEPFSPTPTTRRSDVWPDRWPLAALLRLTDRRHRRAGVVGFVGLMVIELARRPRRARCRSAVAYCWLAGLFLLHDPLLMCRAGARNGQTFGRQCAGRASRDARGQADRLLARRAPRRGSART